jgi:penicillin-binding protein 1C
MTPDELEESSVISAPAIWLMIKAMVEVERPEDEHFWREFGTSRKIAWKTGTSFGFRDAWSIGFDKNYPVAVWSGNADGEGRPGLTGINTAAPVLFDIFNILPYSGEWYDKPEFGMVRIPVCNKSGYRAGEFCSETDTIWIPESGLRFPACPYHKLIHLDSSGKYQVSDDCVSPSDMVHKTWYVLPPAMGYYYKMKNASYKPLPKFRDDCTPVDQKVMELIYPRDINKVYIPVNLDGTISSVIFEMAHREAGSIIYWHIDNEYIGTTENFHKMPVNTGKGFHTLTAVDEKGNVLTKRFEVLNK